MNSLTTSKSTASPQELAAEVVKMFASYASFYQPPEQFKLTVAAYVEKISAYPLPVVSSARVRITDRERAKPPNAGELVAECERVQFPAGRNFAAANKPAEAPTDPVMMARLSGLMKGLARDLAANSTDPRVRAIAGQKAPEDVRKAAEARLVELHAQRNDPMALSPQALASIGLGNFGRKYAESRDADEDVIEKGERI